MAAEYERDIVKLPYDKGRGYMKVRLITIVLMLATVLGLFGCSANVTEEISVDKTPNFISSGQMDLLANADATGERPQNLMNFGKASASNPTVGAFQIVYPANLSQTIKDEANAFATEIYNTTDVSIHVATHLEPQRDCEIILQAGNQIARKEILSVTDAFDSQMNDNNFLIKAIGSRLVVYGKTEQAIVTALLFLRGTLSYQNAEAKEYGVDDTIEFLYKPVEHPPVTVINASDKNYFEFLLENSEMVNTLVRLSFTGNHGWRLQTKAGENDVYNDEGAAQRLARSLGEADPSVLEEIAVEGPVDGIYQLNASDGSYVKVNTNEGAFRLEFYTPSDKLAASVNNITTDGGGSVITGDLEADDAIFGTGERFNESNQRGNYIDMFSKDIWSRHDACYMVIPLLSFSRGSGIFVNQYEPMTMDLGKENKDQWKTVVTGVPLDVYFFATDEIKDVLKGYSELTGYAGMPEEWTYGMIVCAYSPDLSQKWTASITPSEDGRGEGIYEMIANMEKHDLPWTGVLAEAWGGYTTSKHEDLKELCDYVHSLGKKFLVYMAVASIGPGMGVNTELSTSSVGVFQPSYYLYQQQSNGSSYQLPETVSGNNNPDVGGGTRKRVYLDITNPDAVNWYFNEYWTYLSNDIGVDGCKIDFCEQIPENYPLLYYDKSMPTNGSHHWFPSAFCAMFWDMIAAKPDSGMCYTRGGGIGAQRAPYMWAGDQTRDYTSLGYQLKAVLSSGLSGVPFMSYDMSGYAYGDFSIAAESQVMIRGTQFSAFTICIQTHGDVRRSYQFAEEDPNYLYVTEIYRAYTKLHEHLTPYITELSEIASTTGMPVMRHLVLGWQDDKNVYGIEDEYMFGDAFLIAPILNENNVRKIYLPEGEWLDLNTGEEYPVGAEGKWLESYEASIAELPTFYNVNTESEIAPTLVDGIIELYDYARSVAP